MDSDAQTLATALAVLRQQFGNRLAGSIDGTQAQLRGALVQQMGADDLLADRLVKRLTETGRLRYVGAGADRGDGLAPASRPDVALPGTDAGQGESQFVAPAAAVGMMAAPDAAGMPGGGRAAAPMVIHAVAASGAREGAAGRIPADKESADAERDGGDQGRAENRAGATTGAQLGDTNVSGPSSPIEAAVAGGSGDADAGGYWQIG